LKLLERSQHANNSKQAQGSQVHQASVSHIVSPADDEDEDVERVPLETVTPHVNKQKPYLSLGRVLLSLDEHGTVLHKVREAVQPLFDGHRFVVEVLQLVVG
jgi:hypothetical protein